MLAFTLTAFLELMDHGIVSWDLISLSFIKQVPPFMRTSQLLSLRRLSAENHGPVFFFLLFLFIFYVFIPAESEWALLPSYRSYYADIAARV